MAGAATDPPEIPSPIPPRLPAHLAAELDPDLDPDFPDIEAAAIEDVDLSFPTARTLSVLRSRLTGCRIDADTDAALDVVDTVLTDLDLTGRTVAGLQRVELVRCRLGGGDFGEAGLVDVTFDGCVLDLASMRRAHLERVAVRGGRVDGLDLTGARVVDATFADVPLAGVTLDGARLQQVDLTDADLTGFADVSTIRGATISEPQAIELAGRLARAAGLAVRRLP